MKTLKIFGDIVSNSGCKNTPEDVCLSDVKSFLETLEKDEPYEVQICSCGGDVYQGIAIYNLIKESSKSHNVTTHVISLAASIASIIACAGDMVIDSNSYLMIHLPFSCGFVGNALEMENEIKNLNQIKETLISIYKTKFNLSEKEIEDLMIAETWIDANSISDYGIDAKVNEIENEYQIAASIKKNIRKFNNIPINIKDLVKMEEKEKEEIETTETEEKETVDNTVEEEVKEETVEVEEVKEDTPTEEKTEEVIEPVEEEKTEEVKDECVEEEEKKEEENAQAKIIANYENKILNFTKELKDKDDEISNLKNEIITIKNNLASLNGAVNRLSPIENKVDWKSLKGEDFFKYLKQHPELTK